MTRVTDTELDELLIKHKENPNDLDIINLIAIGYFQNYEKKADKDDFDFFEKAYTLKKTVKSTHNFAWFLYFEWSEIQWRWKEGDAIKKALKIQKECIDLDPKSFYPYYQYGYMLMGEDKFTEAIKYLNIAKTKTKNRGVEHNLGFCYYRLGQYQLAKSHFSKSSETEDLEHRSLFNLALVEYKLNNLDKVTEIIDKLQNPSEADAPLMDYEIGQLLFLVNEFEKSAQWTIKQGVDGIDLLDWKGLAYSIYTTNKKLFYIELQKGISERHMWIEEINDNHPDWTEYSEEEKKEKLIELENEIKYRENIEKEFQNKPILNVDELLIVEPIYCLLFDCKLHGNLKND
ncbi:MAG: tetratricopeptide repeat protein [Vicingaceae bacterium]|jgi:tetratricopeptide (TPR) repeat protein|nr:tetratricopeptide repeat protein [Vicingaceae bacterium]